MSAVPCAPENLATRCITCGRLYPHPALAIEVNVCTAHPRRPITDVPVTPAHAERLGDPNPGETE